MANELLDSAIVDSISDGELSIELLKKHRKLQAQLKDIKEKEFDLRKKITGIVFGEQVECRAKDEIGGIAVSMVAGVTTSFDKEAISSIYGDLSNEEKNAIDWVPKINTRKLPEDSIVWECSSTKPSAPTIKYEPV